MRRILDDAGHTVIEATDGASALASYELERPALVTLDLIMSGMDGLEVEEVISTFPSVASENRHAIVVTTAFKVKGSSVAGYVALVLGVASLTELVAKVEAWEARVGDPC